MIFDRSSHELEVWRRETDCYLDTSSVVRTSNDPPDMHHLPSQDRKRGVYRHFAGLANPVECHLFRFVYPDLLAVSVRSTEAYIWDIPSAALVQTIQLNIDFPDHINYADISRDHIFVCSTHSLTIFSRQNGAIVFKLPDGHSSPVFSPCTMGGGVPHASKGLLETRTLIRTDPSRGQDRYCFREAHVSPCGRSVVAVTGCGHVFHIPDFVGSGQPDSSIGIVKVWFGLEHYSVYDGKRIAFCTVSSRPVTISMFGVAKPSFWIGAGSCLLYHIRRPISKSSALAPNNIRRDPVSVYIDSAGEAPSSVGMCGDHENIALDELALFW